MPKHANINIDITPEQKAKIQSILKQHVSIDTKIWVFGSRAKQQARKFSDLDLILDAPKPLSHYLLADLASDFEESDLPYKVDLLDWRKTSESFKKIIDSERVLLNIW